MEEVLISPTWAEINLDNLKFNYESLKHLCRESKISAVVKANAYGHGSVELSKFLEDLGITYFSVSSIQEGLELRRAGIKSPIMTLTPIPEGYEDYAIEEEIEPTVSCFKQAEILSIKSSKVGKVCDIHIKIDTGMGRIGFSPSEDSLKEIKSISGLPNIRMKGVFTHFASADEEGELTKKQYEIYIDSIRKLEDMGIVFDIKHIDNDAALMIYDYREDMVRLGIGLYGLFPSNYVKNKSNLKLKPVMSLKSKIIHIKDVEAGSGIGYGHSFVASEDLRVATIAIGYADGVPRALSNKGHIKINGNKCKIIGRICMDQLMVDISGVEAEIGDEVLIFGDDEEQTADSLAFLCDTINYEIISGINRRVPRVYKSDNRIVKAESYLNY